VKQPTPAPSDSRVRRTRTVIQEAFINLTVEKGYAAITVQDIADRAQINRSIFYRHYLDKDDLLSKYMDEVTNVTFKDEIVDEPTDQQGIPTGLVKLLNHIQTFSAFYRIMLSANGHPLVSDRLRRKIEKRFRERLMNGPVRDPKDPSFEMRLRYISGAGIGAILWWVENNMPCTAEELALWVTELGNANLGFSLRRVDYPAKSN
jgi:AcrR family transcriptional regulator